MFGLFLLGALAASAQPKIGAAVNAGDYTPDLAPGALVAIFGSGFGTGTAYASNYPLPTALAGTSVQVSDGTTTATMPLWFVSPGQINGQLPYGLKSPANLTVTTTAGSSAAVAVKLAANAPKFFTVGQGGTGFIVATHANGSLVSRPSAVTPGETVVLYMNSLGAVNPPVAAGVPPGDGTTAGGSLSKAVDPVSVLLDTLGSSVTYAGLAPGFPGLYQINFVAPYDDKIGDAGISVKAGSTTTQIGVTMPVRSNGLYFVLSGGKITNGQTYNGVSGANSSIAVRHNNAQAFGPNGLGGWSKTTGLAASSSGIASIALTMKSGGNIVFDNNGLETGAVGNYYSTLPGFNVFFAMSALNSPTAPANALQGVYAGYFKLSATTTVDQLIGYFEGALNVNPPFDPANIYNKFRMNIFSNVSGSPRNTGNYVGDVFTSDTTAGTFSYSATGIDRVGTDGTKVPAWRLVYTLKTPISLPAGEYWFTHDVATPSGSGTATSAVESPRALSLRPASGVK